MLLDTLPRVARFLRNALSQLAGRTWIAKRYVPSESAPPRHPADLGAAERAWQRHPLDALLPSPAADLSECPA